MKMRGFLIPECPLRGSPGDTVDCHAVQQIALPPIDQLYMYESTVR
ncbi:hypothetical protein Rleg_2511 [Rhizobium leguminosarum bv. trifolii WSM1325]|jgi:hypothetical protein|uniref:Uncharacterized protein n=1 Tax=Rhizobium leguminosarum bv. trifolii (strain WSM1325) TaxID=395491 RepID=C6B2T4_RHILS|nr:hypothetical protein Rleg_2511 [Rhizobium leguminosarum bv. trifolii WSM1325]